MKLKISNKIFSTYPNLRIGIVVARGIKNRLKDDTLEELKRKRELNLRQKYTSETLSAHPYIWAWRETYRSFGVKPKKYNPTCEALIRRILAGERIPNINIAVDAYLLLETEFFLPCGGYDLDKVYGDIYLRHSDGGEIFNPLGNPDTVEETNPDEVVYSDDKRILTRKWNFRDCDFTKITVNSTNVAFFVEAAREEILSEDVQKFILELENLLSRFCGGIIESFMADAKKLEWVLI